MTTSIIILPLAPVKPLPPALYTSCTMIVLHKDSNHNQNTEGASPSEIRNFGGILALYDGGQKWSSYGHSSVGASGQWNWAVASVTTLSLQHLAFLRGASIRWVVKHHPAL